MCVCVTSGPQNCAVCPAEEPTAGGAADADLHSGQGWHAHPHRVDARWRSGRQGRSQSQSRTSQSRGREPIHVHAVHWLLRTWPCRQLFMQGHKWGRHSRLQPNGQDQWYFFPIEYYILYTPFFHIGSHLCLLHIYITDTSLLVRNVWFIYSRDELS